ncbi:PPC domain-containing protein [Leptothoe spongobia]|uniref:PPC domain-containing protein n=1 Tax=Leptothoe spongobia TAU-MAC 1115 TaxID=1967444 RepID=A0A947DGS6_9CYAN|nr:PPC domain-containing protein [Leptothoe spongobia]MBT9316640.1 PPC domain-containing protein [Leptothoe spongobia TAU-MAC 1115]
MKLMLPIVPLISSFVMLTAAVGQAPAEPSGPIILNVAKGNALVSGNVSTGYNLFQFEGSQGQTITLDVDVTEILAGTSHTDEDSQLYLLDHQGRILAYNDDETENNFESRISQFILPKSGTYYAAVTTFGNTPVINDQQQITAWNNSGLSHIRYDLLVQSHQ